MASGEKREPLASASAKIAFSAALASSTGSTGLERNRVDGFGEEVHRAFVEAVEHDFRLRVDACDDGFGSGGAGVRECVEEGCVIAQRVGVEYEEIAGCVCPEEAESMFD